MTEPRVYCLGWANRLRRVLFNHLPTHFKRPCLDNSRLDRLDRLDRLGRLDVAHINRLHHRF